MLQNESYLQRIIPRQHAPNHRALHAQGESLEAITDQLNKNCFETAKGEAFDVERVKWILGKVEDVKGTVLSN